MNRLIEAISLAFVVMLLAVACGGGGDDSGSNPTETTPGEPTTASRVDDSSATVTAGETATTSSDGSPTALTTPSSTTGMVDPTATPDAGPAASTFAFGWNVGLRGDDGGQEHNQKTADLVTESGFGWVRFQIEWNTFESQPEQWDPLPTDRKIDALNARGINILICVAKAPGWALSTEPGEFLRDYEEFGRFMSFIGDRYKGKVQAWEIWNEQNLAGEVNGFVNVEEYVKLLKTGYTSLKAVDPDALVLFGGLTPNGVNDPTIAIDDAQYLREAYAFNGGEIAQYFDVLGVHLNGTHNSPDNTWPDNVGENQGWNDHPSFFFRRAEELRQIMIGVGDSAKPMWITEVGWSTENQAEGRGYGANNTDEEVAAYLTRALEIAIDEWDFVTGAFIWNLNWATLVEPDNHMYPSSAVRADWSTRPAYEALKAFPKD